MDKRSSILPLEGVNNLTEKLGTLPHELFSRFKNLSFLKRQEDQREKLSKDKRFYEETRSTNGHTTGLGRAFQYHVAKNKDESWTLLSQIKNFIVANFIVKSIENALKGFAKLNIGALGLNSAQNTQSPQDDLTNSFTRTTFVSDAVYEALHEHVTEFQTDIDLVEQRTEEALNSDFVGPLTQEFEAMRQGAQTMPLACEFHAHAKLAEKGIQYLQQENTFIFPEDLVHATREAFGEPLTNHGPRHILVFEESAGNNAQETYSLRPDRTQIGAPVPIEVRTNNPRFRLECHFR